MHTSNPRRLGSLTVTPSSLNVRSGPSLAGDVIGSLPRGRVVTAGALVNGKHAQLELDLEKDETFPALFKSR